MDDVLGEWLAPDDEYDPVEAASAFPHIRRAGELVPNLDAIPEARWDDALRALTPELRRLAMADIAEARPGRAQNVLLRLAAEDERRRQRALDRSRPPDVGPLGRRRPSASPTPGSPACSRSAASAAR